MSCFTPYHAKYIAYDLTRKVPSNNIAKLTASIQDAQVDLNPHQVEAALFAFKSPLSQGAILADEVGLGKTIEAGILLSQLWAEQKRKLIIICPANLRKQWSQELLDKFFLPSTILENKSFNEQIGKGNLNPFDNEENIIICSYQFVKSKAAYITATIWDLVIIDEAHRLRNVYKPNNKISNIIKTALADKKKVLLTATPLQNSILELYGLISIIDEYAFGDLDSFRKQYSKLNVDNNFDNLKERLTTICNRTLRRQVNYIHFTNRIPICESFNPTADEHALYEMVSEFIQRPNLYALPSSQRTLITLNIRKLLASSSYAIFETLSKMIIRLQNILTKIKKENSFEEDKLIAQEFLLSDLDEYNDNYEIDNESLDEEDDNFSDENIKCKYSLEDVIPIQNEIEDLKCFQALAKSIVINSKAEHLFTALDKAFIKLLKLGANQKALIFTESRRTQSFLFDLLQERGYSDKVVLFNGTNNDSLSNKIYQNWLIRHKNSGRISGSLTADKRDALVEYFRDEAEIMIATEAAAEGVNLQFCSLVVNYDLPWNPQRIEQRIGRCHRYGQQHDVVVVNFLNTKNAAEVRIHELLETKFELFDGVFGASDKVLGAIGSGVDFEKRITSILDRCRTKQEIDYEFDKLDQEMEALREDKMEHTRKLLLEHFDDEVREKLKGSKIDTISNLRNFELKLWSITKYALHDYADFNEEKFIFKLKKLPSKNDNYTKGIYQLLRVDDDGKRSDIFLHDDAIIYRVGHPLAKSVIKTCKTVDTQTRKLFFNYTSSQSKITLLEPYIGISGWLRFSCLRIESFEPEDFLVVSCTTDNGDIISSDIAVRLFSISASIGEKIEIDNNTTQSINSIQNTLVSSYLKQNEVYNNIFLIEEINKLNAWAEDQVEAKTLELKQTKIELKEKERLSRHTNDSRELLELQKAIRTLESKQSRLRREMFVVEDEIRARRDKMIEEIETRMKQRSEIETVFTVRWQLI